MRALAVDLRDGVAEHELDALAACAASANQRADRPRRAARAAAAARASTTVTSAPGGARRRRDLLADEPGADDQQARAGAQQLAQQARVLERAQRADVRVRRRTPAACAASRRSRSRGAS